MAREVSQEVPRLRYPHRRLQARLLRITVVGPLHHPILAMEEVHHIPGRLPCKATATATTTRLRDPLRHSHTAGTRRATLPRHPRCPSRTQTCPEEDTPDSRRTLDSTARRRARQVASGCRAQTCHRRKGCRSPTGMGMGTRTTTSIMDIMGLRRVVDRSDGSRSADLV